jgi:hypothetical protein
LLTGDILALPLQVKLSDNQYYVINIDIQAPDPNQQISIWISWLALHPPQKIGLVPELLSIRKNPITRTTP